MGKDEKPSKYHYKYSTATAVLQSPIIIVSCTKRKVLIYFFLKANSSNRSQFVGEIFMSKIQFTVVAAPMSPVQKLRAIKSLHCLNKNISCVAIIITTWRCGTNSAVTRDLNEL